jgi:hypothetical integral membrane protein (TIGR02206 family)
MQPFFSAAYPGPPFVILGIPHIGALAALVLLNLVLARFRKAGERTRAAIRYCLAGVLWAAEISWHVWNVAVATWSARYLLPLNVCSILIWLSGFMLIFKDRRIYEFAYFLGIGAAAQYLATPDLGIYGFPHFRFFQTFLSHGLLLTAPIYMTVVEGFRPNWRSLLRVVLWTNVYMVAIFRLNLALGSDYLMLNAKPATPSLLDLLPPWPVYIVFMELIGLLTFLLLYVPFLVADWRSGRSRLPRHDPPGRPPGQGA